MYSMITNMDLDILILLSKRSLPLSNGQSNPSTKVTLQSQFCLIYKKLSILWISEYFSKSCMLTELGVPYLNG